ncbi:DUF2971 domain-containing protein [Pseudomonas pergaminensis]|uniref:DUF2971 domain-containing protein n=1 Tax=Pseudomonas pergaminensis TaxID=2853159 RepID=A0ABD7TEQ4_9PSED|nr:DUF2971 domain-containing protein [Pseudomonas pergaminensis]USV99900.1 DUF2971 domain-containing protein [Pseudomonas pergaminensis]
MSILYHYTSQQGLLGVLDSKSIWATNTHYLNDPTEFVHALSFARAMASHSYEDDYWETFGFMLHGHLNKMDEQDLYVSSFSEKPDLLSQWRGYCPGGSGYCIGFDQRLVAEYCEERGIRLEKCLYKHEDQAGAVATIISAGRDCFPSVPHSVEEFFSLPTEEKLDCMFAIKDRLNGDLKPEADRVLNTICNLLLELAPLFKHEGFHEEAEWRIISNKPDHQVRFRTGPSYVIPYISIDLLNAKPDVLKKLIVGPNPNQARAAKAAELLVKQYGYDKSIVTCSDIPFNNW